MGGGLLSRLTAILFPSRNKKKQNKTKRRPWLKVKEKDFSLLRDLCATLVVSDKANRTQTT